MGLNYSSLYFLRWAALNRVLPRPGKIREGIRAGTSLDQVTSRHVKTTRTDQGESQIYKTQNSKGGKNYPRTRRVTRALSFQFILQRNATQNGAKRCETMQYDETDCRCDAVQDDIEQHTGISRSTLLLLFQLSTFERADDRSIERANII